MRNLTKLQEKVSYIQYLKKLSYDNSDFSQWKSELKNILKEIFWEIDERVEAFGLIKFGFSYNENFSSEQLQNKYLNWLKEADNFLNRLIWELEQNKWESIEILENVFNRFTYVVSQLRRRYSNRSTLKINDEYDVQDLLHALLKIYFDDIRNEETNPSFAWASSRADFLLKDEKIVIEVKCTKSLQKDKNIGEQIILDSSKYKDHPDCEMLVCFVYDPENFIKNPKGLEKDLENTEDLDVKVYIRN